MAKIKQYTDGQWQIKEINAGTVAGYVVGNASGNIPLANGTTNTNLNADKIDGKDAVDFQSANINLPTVNDTYVGETINATIDSATTVVFGDIVYRTPTGFKKAQANNASNTGTLVGMVVDAGGTGGTHKILINGYVKRSYGIADGTTVYLSTDTVGTLTNTKPSTTGQQIQIMGTTVAIDTICFNPSPVIIEI